MWRWPIAELVTRFGPTTEKDWRCVVAVQANGTIRVAQFMTASERTKGSHR